MKWLVIVHKKSLWLFMCAKEIERGGKAGSLRDGCVQIKEMWKDRKNSVCLRDKEILNIIYGRGKVGDDCKVCECVLEEGNIVKDY